MARQTPAEWEAEQSSEARLDAYRTTVEQLRSDLELRDQTARDRKEALATLEAEIEHLRHDIERHIRICAEQQAEIERLRAVADAARKIPRWTPKGGAASTMHTHQIMAADTWALDKALSDLKAVEQSGTEK